MENAARNKRRRHHHRRRLAWLLVDSEQRLLVAPQMLLLLLLQVHWLVVRYKLISSSRDLCRRMNRKQKTVSDRIGV